MPEEIREEMHEGKFKSVLAVGFFAFIAVATFITSYFAQQKSSRKAQTVIDSRAAVTSSACTDSLCAGLQGYWNMDQTYTGSPIVRLNSHSASFTLEDKPALGGHVTNCHPGGICASKINKASYFHYDDDTSTPGIVKPARDYPPYLYIPPSQSQPPKGPNGEFTI